MNQLWAEADSIIDKALGGCSTYLLENIGASASPSSYPDSNLIRGKEFVFWAGATHSATSTSVLYSAFDTIPNAYDQSTYDTAASGATIATYSSDGYAHVDGSSTPDLTRSLKAHTRTNSGQEYYIWEYDQPAPEKKWKFAVAEVIIATASGTSFSMPDSYEKYSCWRIHNLTDRDFTIYCGSFSDPHKTFTLPAYNQICVRRVGTTFHTDYKYFFKCLVGDPRFLYVDSFDGSIAETMRANNITNPNYLYNLFEFVGMDNSPLSVSDYNATSNRTKHHQRIYFNPSTVNDIGSEYATAGHFPTISDTTKVGDTVYHKGAIGYRKKDTSGSTLEVGTIDFDGWDSFGTNLATIDAALAATGITNNNDTKIATSATPSLLEIWPVGTNVLQINDQNAVKNLASTTYNLQTHFLFPPTHGSTPRVFNRYFLAMDDLASNGTNPNIASTSYNGRTYTVGSLKSYLDTYQSNSTPESKSVALTSEGPFLLWRDVFEIKGSGDSEGWFDGLSTNHGFSLELVSGTPKLKIEQEWFIPLRLHSSNYTGSSAKAEASYLIGYACGWPSQWKDAYFNAVVSNRRHHIDAHKFHRVHETPRKKRQYETATPITAGTETFKHNDINNDPVGLDGADLTLNDVGTLTETDTSFLTNDIDAEVSKGSFSGGEVNNPNYSRLVIDDVMQEVEASKNDSSLNTIKTPASYNRINLMKEHFNNFAVLLKKADKIRPLSVDEIYFGNRIMKPGQGWLNGLVAPVELYEGFTDGDAQFDLYTDLLGSSKIRTYSDFSDGTAIYNAASTSVASGASQSEQDDVYDFRWVKIEDVQEFAKDEGFGFRFEEVAAPAFWTTSFPQSTYTGSTITATNCFLVATSTSTTNNYKVAFPNGMVVGQHYGTGFDYVQLTDSVSETLGTTFYREDVVNAQNTNYNLLPIFKNNLGTSANADGYATGLVIQVVDGLNSDGTSQRTNNPRAKLGLVPLKTVRLDNPGTSSHAGTDVDIDASDAPETAAAELVSITSDKQFYFPTTYPRTRYAFLLNTTAALTHSA